jgi:type IV secretion system protein VirD4
MNFLKDNAKVLLWISAGFILLFLAFWLSSFLLLLLGFHDINFTQPFFYWEVLYSYNGDSALKSWLMLTGIVGLVFFIGTLMRVIKFNPPNLYGSARFATRRDIKRARLMAGEGIVLGEAYGVDLSSAGFEHVTVFAPTGLGKTTSITEPNLFFWQGSIIASDIKLQLFQRTSVFRQKVHGNAVYLFNPASPEGLTHRYNPLSIIGSNPYTRIDEIQKIAGIFIPDAVKSDPIWQVQARFLFVALVLYVLDTPVLPNNLAAVIAIVKSTANLKEWIDQELASRNDLDAVCRNNFLKFIELHDKTRLSILATFQSYFELFDSPLISAATACSDFDIRDLRRKKMTIYVGVTNDDLVRLAPLLTVFYQQVADVMTRKLPDKDEPHPVLFLMDEFASLRRMESFHKNIGLYRDYRLRIVIIIQELSQLYDNYGRDGARVFINSRIRVAFTQNDQETCKLIEESLGDTTVLVKNRSRKLIAGLQDGQGSESTQYVRRPLLLAQEVRQLPEDKALILVQGFPAILAKKIISYKDKRLVKCMMGAITVPSTLPTIAELAKIAELVPNRLKPESAEEKVKKQKTEKIDKTKEALENERLKAEILADALKRALVK